MLGLKSLPDEGKGKVSVLAVRLASDSDGECGVSELALGRCARARRGGSIE